jgi:hypothetical protein
MLAVFNNAIHMANQVCFLAPPVFFGPQIPLAETRRMTSIKKIPFKDRALDED